MGACNSKGDDKGKKQYSAPDIVDHDAGHHSNIAVHQGSVLGITSRGNLIASCGDDKMISLSDRKLLQSRSADLYQPTSLSGHEKAVNRVHFDSHNGLLYSASRDLSIRLWDASGGESSAKHVRTIPNSHTLNVSSVVSHPFHNNRLFSGSRDYSVKVWDVSRAVDTASEAAAGTSVVEAVAEYHAPRNIVTALTTCAYETNLLYQGSEDLCVRVWDLRQSSATVPAIHLTGYVYFPLCLDRQQQDGEYLLASGTKGFNSVGCGVMVWDMRNTAKPLFEFKGPSQDVTGVQFSKSSRPGRSHLIYSVCKDGSFMVWDSKRLEQVGCYRFEGNKLLSCLSVLHSSEGEADAEEVAVGAMDGSVSILSVTADGDNSEYIVRPIVSTKVTVEAD